MMRRIAVVALLWLGGCLYTHNSKCEQEGYPPDEELGLWNPTLLYCDYFYVPGCDEDCGVCAPLPDDVPTWAECGGPCFGIDEERCAITPGCRIARLRSLYYFQFDAPPAFRGCHPVDTVAAEPVPCRGLLPLECSRYDYCAYLLDSELEGGECVPEDQIAGRCFDSVTCADPPPTCPADTTPGALDGCYTGSCIPNEYCGLPAPP